MDPNYKPFVFYAKGYKSESNKCTLMSPPTLKCVKQPLFSNYKYPYKNEIFGQKYLIDNAEWMKQNRFVLQMVGDSKEQCPRGQGLSYVPWLLKCLSVDLLITPGYGLLWCVEEKTYTS